MRRPFRFLLPVVAIACSPLEPDPVIKDGVDLGPIQSFEGERMPTHSGMGSINDKAASDNHALALYSDSKTSIMIELLNEVAGVEVRARGDQCEGAPHMLFKVDGTVRIDTQVSSTSWTEYPALVHLGAGPHTFALSFDNDKYDGKGCDRNLYVDKVTFINVRPVTDGNLPAFALLATSGTGIADDKEAPDGKALGLYSPSSATGIIRTNQAAGLAIRARADLCRGAPQFLLGVDGVTRGWFEVPSVKWAEYRAPVDLAPGEHLVTIEFTNDFAGGGCDRNLYLADIASVETAPPPVPLAEPVVLGPPAPPTPPHSAPPHPTVKAIPPTVLPVLPLLPPLPRVPHAP